MDESEDLPPEETVPRRDWGRIALRGVVGAVLALVLLLLAVFMFVQSDAGRQFAARQVSGMTFGNGLRIAVGRIDGSLLGKTRLLNVVAYDTQGRFLSAPEIDLDWRPLAYLGNHVDISSARAALVTLERAPQFKVSTTQGPLLPDLNIDMGRVQIDRLIALPAVSCAGVSSMNCVAVVAELTVVAPPPVTGVAFTVSVSVAVKAAVPTPVNVA